VDVVDVAMNRWTPVDVVDAVDGVDGVDDVDDVDVGAAITVLDYS